MLHVRLGARILSADQLSREAMRKPVSGPLIRLILLEISSNRD